MPRKLPRKIDKTARQQHRKEHPEHHEAALRHTMRRLKERYGITVTYREMQNISNNAWKHAEVLGEVDHDRMEYLIRMTIKGQAVKMIFSLRIGAPVTAYTTDVMLRSHVARANGEHAHWTPHANGRKVS